jgi:O-antigen ligase
MKKFAGLFLFGLVLLCWGRIGIHLSSQISLSAGGAPFYIMTPLFLCFLYLKVRNREWHFSADLTSPLFILSVFALASVLWSRGCDLSLFAGMVAPALMGYIMLRGLLATLGEEFFRERFLPVFCASPLLLVIRGIVESSGHLMGFGELDSPFEQHTLLSMNLLFVLPFTLMGLITDEKRRTLYGISIFFTVLSVVLCGSKVGLVSLFLLLALAVLCFGNAKVRIIAVLGGLVGIISLFLLPFTHQRFVGLLSISDDPYLITRTRIWDMTYSFVKDHLLFGIGFSRKTFLAMGIERFGEDIFFYEHPHNLYFQILALLGFAGMVLFLWLAVDLGGKIVRLSRCGKPECVLLGRAAALSFVVFLFNNLVEGALNSGRMMLTLLLVVAVVDHFHGKIQGKKEPAGRTGEAEPLHLTGSAASP